MWIVKLALRRPYTFVVMCILILVTGMVAIFRAPMHIFTNINIPVVSVIWTLNGLIPKDMSEGVVSVTERMVTALNILGGCMTRGVLLVQAIGGG